MTSSTNDGNQSVHLNASDISFSQLLSNPSSSTGTFLVPPVPRAKKTLPKTRITKAPQRTKRKPHLFCTYCNQGYVCSRSFKTHVRKHQMEGMIFSVNTSSIYNFILPCYINFYFLSFLVEGASRFPDTADMMEHAEEIGMQALIKVSNEPCFGVSAVPFRELVGHVVSLSSGAEWKQFSSKVCAELVKGIAQKKCLLPSTLICSLMDQQENILSNFNLSDSLLDIIGVNSNTFSGNTSAQFFLKFMLFFTTELLKYISKTFRANLPRTRVAKLIGEPDKEDRQVIYYIAGSIARGYLKIGKRFPKSKMWQDVVSVLKTKVLMDKPEGDMPPDAEWTNDVDRGALLYINTKCQDLFVKVTKVIYSFEKRDGSIDYDSVIKEVCNSQLSVDWDNIISDSLNETVSFNVLSDITKCLSQTCGRGIAKRRLNFIRKRGVASMTTRHLAASRKNR